MSCSCEIVTRWSNTPDFRNVIENLRVKKIKFVKQQLSNIYESKIEENISNSLWRLAEKFSYGRSIIKFYYLSFSDYVFHNYKILRKQIIRV